MKLKIIALTILAVIIYSCASKTAVAPTTPKPPPIKEVVKTTDKDAKVMVMTEELTIGKTTYENNCAKCHRLFAAKEFSKEDWAPILVKMQMKAHLDDAQMASITNYIYTQL
ncbi:cytochrome c [Flavobacterium sp.]|uniref:cytochrome c n=1 Tax=Flavobacterium sp. TaxID=239 RepID=UPI00286B5CFB|nr:cytochrome c [Flavobacterium sp.]